MKWHQKLKLARQVKGVSLREVEKATGVSNAYLSQLENGQIKEPGFFVAMRLLSYFNLRPADLIESSEDDGWLFDGEYHIEHLDSETVRLTKI